MFSRISRYRSLPDDVTVDVKGRALASKGLRSLPDVSGDFFHTVEEGDRLDHLAYKYYKQPRDWWRIADANPAFLSPLAMLGKEPTNTLQLPLTWDGPVPPWSDLLQALIRTLGVDDALTGTADHAFAEPEVDQGTLDFDIAPALAAELDASAAAQTISSTLAQALAAEGVTLSPDVRLEKPDATIWRITDRQTHEIRTFRLFEGGALLNVYQSTLRYRWIVVVTYNTLVVTATALLDLIESRGFSAGPPMEARRTGKAIVVPPRKARI